LQDVVNVKDFGATGNGSTNDATAVQAAYTYAQTLGVGAKVVFPQGTYLLTTSINATGVSTEGYFATLNFTLNSNSYAFSWGGNDTYVTGIKFQLANSSTTAAMQGIINTVNNVKNQKFFNNHVIASTTLTSGSSSIYGPWFTGTGLDGVYFYSNHMESCSYGFQLNNQAAGSNNVITNPLGSPTHDVFVYDNTFIDCTLGVNTPGIYCYNVQIHHNTIRPVNFSFALPLNVAHVTGLSITDNIVSANAVSGNGVIHLEDVTQAFTITGNKITTTADNTGIMMTVQSGVSQDNPPTYRGIVANNHLVGGTSTGNGIGIDCNDSSTLDMTIANNYIYNFGNGIETFGYATINANTLITCTNGIALYTSPSVSENTFRNCTNAYYNARGFWPVRGGMIYDVGLVPTKNSANSGVLYENVHFYVESVTITSNTAFDLFPLPSASYNGTIIIGFGVQGFISANISWNGTTFTSTTLGTNLPGILGTPGLSRDATTGYLSVTVFVSGGSVTTGISVTINGLVY
jgi:hypothetical protein